MSISGPGTTTRSNHVGSSSGSGGIPTACETSQVQEDSIVSLGQAAPSRDLCDSSEDEAPLLTAEEEMQYQRALWVNRLLKEQLAAQTQGLSIREIEEAQAQIQERMRDANRFEAWSGVEPSGRLGRPSYASFWGRSAKPPAMTAHSAVNRRRRDERIQQENSAFLRRLESVKSTFTPRVAASDRIQRISPRSRLVNTSREG
mmetsp:Transcript_82088/g.213860  ORF Transcript_82088/g.213860 Transcript_82088/m.213860 type:complete len:202 (+) Transcript_82088:60-665(+)